MEWKIKLAELFEQLGFRNFKPQTEHFPDKQYFSNSKIVV